MIYTIQPPATSVRVKIRLPASKSISNRILILNALSKSNERMDNLSDSDDTQVLTKALFSLQTGECTDFDIGAAGTSMRFLTAYLAQREGVWTITGTERMKNRPIRILVDSLREIGGKIEYMEKEGFPPLRIHGGKLIGGAIRLNGGVSSQYLSALMMIAPVTQQGLDICLEGNIVSRPYINMTAHLMQTFGVQTMWNGQHLLITPQTYQPLPFTVENDWSAASYWYEITALADNPSSVELTGLKPDSIQGDAKVAKLFEPVVSTEYLSSLQGVVLTNNVIARAKRSETPQSSEKSVCHCGLDLQSEDNYEEIHRQALDDRVCTIDFTNEPDLAQTLAVACCLLDIPFYFTGLHSLRIKETDRILALQTELKKLGYMIETEETTMKWTGERCEADPDPVISTYEDHRMAMAFAPVCMKTGRIRIKEPCVISKSYPGFWNDLEKAGFRIEY